jgi:hypothetical protein
MVVLQVSKSDKFAAERLSCVMEGMKKRKNPIETARTTISSVNKEMQKPRLTASVRNGGKSQTRRSVAEHRVRSEKA